MSQERGKIIREEGLEGVGGYQCVYGGIVIDNKDVEKDMKRVKVCVGEVMGGVFGWGYGKGEDG